MNDEKIQQMDKSQRAFLLRKRQGMTANARLAGLLELYLADLPYIIQELKEIKEMLKDESIL